MELSKIEKILASNVTMVQKNILMMIYVLNEKGTISSPKNISIGLNINYANCAANLRALMYTDILKCTGIGGRAGKEYAVNWEVLNDYSC